MPSPVTLKIKFKSASLQQFIERYSVDISKGGIFIRTPKPLSVGTTLKFEFHLSDGGSLLSGDGTVVWVREPDSTKGAVSPGMGLRFDELPAASQEVLDQILAQKKVPADTSEQATRVAPEAAAELAAMTSPEEEDPEKTDEEAIEPAEPPVDVPLEEEEEEEETEEERNKRLSQIVLGEEEEATPVGAAPLDDGPEAIPSDALSVPPQPQEEKSSGLVWFVILLIIGGMGFIYYQFVYNKPAPAPTPAMDMEVPEAAADMEVKAPEPTGVKMNVESTPAGAKILIDGEDTGKVTPAELAGLDPEKEIKIAFDLTGKKLVTKVLKPTPDLPLAVTLDQAAERKITFTSEPAGATVVVNNLLMGKAPTRLKRRYRPGRVYKVEFKLAGYETFRTEIPGAPSWTRDGDNEMLVVHGEMVKKGGLATPTAPAPAPKARPRPRLRPRPKVRPKVAPKPKVVPEPAPAPKVESKVESKVEPKPDAKPKAKAAVKKPKPKAAVKKPKWADEK